MTEREINYRDYPIIILDPAEEERSWQRELAQDFCFIPVSDKKNCRKILATYKNVAAIIFTEPKEDKKFCKTVKNLFGKVEFFFLITPEEFDYVKFSPHDPLSYHPLLTSSPVSILRYEFLRSIKCYVWKRERDFLLDIHKQEGWFSLIGQLTREWSHEIRNYIAIISLNAEISISKLRKSSGTKALSPLTLEKIMEQCQKISGVLDGVREFSKSGQSMIPSLSILEVIAHAISILSLEIPPPQITIKSDINKLISMSQIDSILLRSGLVNILHYYNLVKQEKTPILISVGKNENGVALKINLKDVGIHTLAGGLNYMDTPINKMIQLEPNTRNFYIGLRLLKSLGGEISLTKDEVENGTTLAVTLPVNLPPDSIPEIEKAKY